MRKVSPGQKRPTNMKVKTYELQDYKVIETSIPEREEIARDTITYNEVEQADTIPATAVIEVEDTITEGHKSDRPPQRL